MIISENVIRARCDPGQRWMPTPNDTWRFGLRSITNVSASGNSAVVAAGGHLAQEHLVALAAW